MKIISPPRPESAVTAQPTADELLEELRDSGGQCVNHLCGCSCSC